MRGGTGSRGYTIIEVMIFLAVSGFMFVLAAVFVSGKQARAEFRQGTNDINSQIASVINDVNNGFFPAVQSFTCSATAGGPPQFSTLSATQQGQNKGCTFLGKIVQFDVAGTDDRGYNVYTVAGRQFVDPNTQTVPTTFTGVTGADPKVADNGSNPYGLTEDHTTQWGLQVTKVTKAGDGAKSYAGVGFFSSFGQYEGGGSLLASGSQDVVVIPIDGSLEQTPTAFVNSIEGNVNNVYAGAASDPNILVCLKGGDNQFATLSIGGSSGQRLTTSIHVYTSSNLPSECSS